MSRDQDDFSCSRSIGSTRLPHYINMSSVQCWCTPITPNTITTWCFTLNDRTLFTLAITLVVTHIGVKHQVLHGLDAKKTVSNDQLAMTVLRHCPASCGLVEGASWGCPAHVRAVFKNPLLVGYYRRLYYVYIPCLLEYTLLIIWGLL